MTERFRVGRAARRFGWAVLGENGGGLFVDENELPRSLSGTVFKNFCTAGSSPTDEMSSRYDALDSDTSSRASKSVCLVLPKDDRRLPYGRLC